MPLIVPVFPSEPLYQERVRLDDRDYILRFDWAHREQRYYLSIYDQDETALLLGIKVIANWGLIDRYHYDLRLPPGELIAIDLEDGGEPPTFADFGTRVRLFYYATDEDLSEFAT